MMNPSDATVCKEELHAAFQNEYIVEHLFSLLSLTDIKNCRLVHKIWRNIGTTFLRRQTHVLFDFLYPTNVHHDHVAYLLESRNQLKEIGTFCKESVPENTPLSSFTFQGEVEYLPLIDFMKDVQNCMMELKIQCAILIDYSKFLECGELIVDVCPKIPAHLTKLHIELRSYSHFIFSLSMDKIPFVKNIHLNNCTIVLDTNGKRVSPSDLTLGRDNKYIKNGIDSVFLINEYFDLTLTQNINLDGKNLVIDFSDCANHKVERIVSLKDVTVRNWEKCNWKMKKLSLEGMEFLEKNVIEIEELKTYNSLIDLSKIYNPTLIKRLYCHYGTTINESPFFLPNLVDVTLGCENCVAKLPYFTKNKNIATMWLKSDQLYDNAMSVNVKDLPLGINNLTLTTVEVHGDAVYPLNILFMEEYNPMSKYYTFGSKFQTETLRIVFGNIITVDDVEIVGCILDSNANCRLIIGHFCWDQRNIFHDSTISTLVDKESEYYLFEGGRGKGLTEEEVNKYDARIPGLSRTKYSWW